jgi:phosphate ABC transporter permease protein PstC
MEAGSLTPSRGDRAVLERSPRERAADPLFRALLLGLGLAVLVIIVYFFIKLISESSDAFSKFGFFGFTFGADWDVSHLQFGAWPLLFGTIVTSAIALVIGVPIAVATALFVTELCPRRFQTPLTILVDLLAAVPSVVYGLWGFLFLAPKLRGYQQFLADKFSFLPFVGGPVAGPSYFIAGIILAIMILPIVSAISREVVQRVPVENKEAALALGATRWEMIRMAILPYSRAGITGAAMLGLGRALGETIAVTLVIGNSAAIGKQVFDQGYTLAAVIANEFGEAANNPLHSSALFAAGLVLFVLTLAVNAAARAVVQRSERLGRREEPDLVAAEASAAVGV